MSILLASGSPQRRAILDQLRMPFRVLVPEVDELSEGVPEAVATENSRRKAAAVAADRECGELLVAVDTVVVLDGIVYGKPADAAQAEQVLTLLRGRTHHVLGALTMLVDDQEHRLLARTAVRFREFDPTTLERYVEGGEWRGRAGGYAIQGTGAALVAGIDGDYLNVVGFPVSAFLDRLDRLNLHVHQADRAL